MTNAIPFAMAVGFPLETKKLIVTVNESAYRSPPQKADPTEKMWGAVRAIGG